MLATWIHTISYILIGAIKSGKNYKNVWYYNGTVIRCADDLPGHRELMGFCYKITNLKTGAIYIGKKHFFSSLRKKLGKKEVSTDRRKKTYRVVVKESDWMNYWGSNLELKEDIRQQGIALFKREILALARSKKYLGYLEAKYQFQYDVLSGKTYNRNILGRFFSTDIEK